MKSKLNAKPVLIFALFAAFSLVGGISFATNPVALAATQNAKWTAKNKISTKDPTSGKDAVYVEDGSSNTFSRQLDDRTSVGCKNTITVNVSKKNPTTGKLTWQNKLDSQGSCGGGGTNTIKLTNKRPSTSSKDCAPNDPDCIDDQDKDTGSGSSSDSDKKFVPCSNLKGKQKTICKAEEDALKNSNTPAETAKSCSGDVNCQEIFTYLIDTVQVFSAIVGVVVVAMIIYGGIEFSTSAGNPEKAASAKSHITNALFALFAFFFLWAFLNFLIPGGVFHG